MPAMDALHLKNILSDDLRGHRLMVEILDSFIRTMEGTEKDVPGLPRPVPSPGGFPPGLEGAHLALQLSKKLDASYTYFADPKMHELITAASESMPEEPLKQGDLPTDYGFLLIPGGLAIIDVRGRLCKWNAVLWCAFGGRVEIWWFTDKYDMTDSGNRDMRAQFTDDQWMTMPHLTVAHRTFMDFGKPLPVAPGPDYMVPPEVEMDITTHKNPDGSHSMAWMVKDNGLTRAELEAFFSSMSVRTDPALRWLLTTWRLMQQTITNVTEEQAPRQLRKRLEKKNLDTKVTVIALRNRGPRGEGDTEVEWSHRWLVRGHWRHQKVKEDGEWTTRLIWIHPHIKGPEGKPLLIREHVYSLQR